MHYKWIKFHKNSIFFNNSSNKSSYLIVLNELDINMILKKLNNITIIRIIDKKEVGHLAMWETNYYSNAIIKWLTMKEIQIITIILNLKKVKASLVTLIRDQHLKTITILINHLILKIIIINHRIEEMKIQDHREHLITIIMKLIWSKVILKVKWQKIRLSIKRHLYGDLAEIKKVNSL